MNDSKSQFFTKVAAALLAISLLPVTASARPPRGEIEASNQDLFATPNKPYYVKIKVPTAYGANHRFDVRVYALPGGRNNMPGAFMRMRQATAQEVTYLPTATLPQGDRKTSIKLTPKVGKMSLMVVILDSSADPSTNKKPVGFTVVAVREGLGIRTPVYTPIGSGRH